MASNRDKARERQERRKTGGDRPVDDPRELMREEYGESLREPSTPPPSEPEEEFSSSDDVESYDPDYDDPDDEVAPTYSRRQRREAEEAGEGSQYDNRPRSVQFLAAVRAELGRVQWPDRQALSALTGVVLGFVLLAGGYLGLIDYVFTQLVRVII